MIHSLKIYAIYSISTNNIEIEDYFEKIIPKDLHEFTKDFIKFFKLNRYSKDLIIIFDNSKDDLLICAAENGYLEVVKYLVENGVDINTDDDEALRYAAEDGYIEVVKYLHKNGANISANDDYALKYAVGNGHFEVVRYLVENGANIHAENDEALKWALLTDHREVIEYLIDNGAKVYKLGLDYSEMYATLNDISYNK